MGGKKGPEKNRKYEKDRRERFNEQLTGLNKHLPDFNPSMMKVSKAEILGRAIQYLKETQSKNQKLENEFENEKIKTSELQKKVARLLQIIKELIKILNNSNISFPDSLSVDDSTSFEEAYSNYKRKTKDTITNEKEKKKMLATDEKSIDRADSKTSDSEPEDFPTSKDTPVTLSVAADPPTFVSTHNIVTSTVSPVLTSVLTSSSHSICSSQLISVEPPNLLRMNTNSLILSEGNLQAVNGLSNMIINNINPSPTILLNKPVALPTLILMQNNVVPVTSVQQIQQTHKLIVPKSVVSTTKTTFINKKPIPAIRLFKSGISLEATILNSHPLKRQRSKRSKGILVKYPKRRPPSKGKRKGICLKGSSTKQLLSSSTELTEVAAAKNDGNALPIQSCNPVESSFNKSVNNVSKNYTDNLFDRPDMQDTNQFVNFFEPTKTATEGVQISTGKEKPMQCFNEETFQRSYVYTPVSCPLIENAATKEQTCKETESSKNLQYFPTTSGNSLLMKYIPSPCPQTVASDKNDSSIRNAVKHKSPTDKDFTPLTVQCNLSEKSSKDIHLTFDNKKSYESSFDDLFTSLQVPSNGQNTDSISPTAAFLSNFPLVSSCKTADLLPDQEEDSNTATIASTTILQIGNLDSPSTLLFTTKNAGHDGKLPIEKADDNFTLYCNSSTQLQNCNESKKKEGKDPYRDLFTSDMFSSQPTKSLQSVPFHPASTASTTSSFPIFSRYNYIPAITSSHYSLPSQPPSTSKTVDTMTEFNSWMPTSTIYNQEEDKEKSQQKCTNFSNTFGLPHNNTEKFHLKKPKQNTLRPLVNWMTSPDLRNVPESQPCNVFSLSKEDTANSNSNNANFNSYSSADYLVDNQAYDSQLNSCKTVYSSSNPASYSWSPSKTSLTMLPLDQSPNMPIPSALPTLVGDLALGSNSVNSYDGTVKKYNLGKRKENCKNYKLHSQNSGGGSFLSVTQLVDNKTVSKVSKKPDNCHFDENQDKCYKENYNLNKVPQSAEYHEKTYLTSCKETKSVKCRKDIKYNPSQCLSKENKKDNHVSQKSLYEYPRNNCQMLSKDVNPLSNKNSNYSAESLISSNNLSNPTIGFTTQNCFPYDNFANYVNCSANKRPEEAESSSTNFGGYPNTNYMYPNNFQTLNNYAGFSNQYCNNYPTQIQQQPLQQKKKTDENQSTKQDADWFKDGISSYSSSMAGRAEFTTNQKDKCKQTLPNWCNYGQKKSINSGMYNSYYQYSHHHHSTSSVSQNSNNTAYSFSQSSHLDENCQTPAYDMKSTRCLSLNSNSQHPATTLTNFNLSTIFPEMNDKHYGQNRISNNIVGSEKNDPKYAATKVQMVDMNYNHSIQPTAEMNLGSESIFYGSSSSFQPAQSFDFTQRKKS